MVIAWQEPPERATGLGSDIYRQLSAHPGEWALIDRVPTYQRARYWRDRLRQQAYRDSGRPVSVRVDPHYSDDGTRVESYDVYAQVTE